MNAAFVRQKGNICIPVLSAVLLTPPHPRMDDQMVRPNECAMISSEAF